MPTTHGGLGMQETVSPRRDLWQPGESNKPPTKWHSLDDIRTWQVEYLGQFVWATEEQLIRAGIFNDTV